MKCPKCSYVSHDYLDTCGKCSMDLVAFKQGIRLAVLQPGDLDLAMAFSDSGEAYGSRGGMSLDDSFFDTQMLVEPENISDQSGEEFDIKIDDDSPQTPTEASAAPGELTKLFYVPEDLANQASGAKPHDAAARRDAETAETVSDEEETAEKTGNPPSSGAGSSMEQNIQSTVHTMEIDMSDLVDLDAGLDEPQEPSITMDPPDIDQAPSVDLEPTPTLEAESPSEPAMAPELDTVADATEEVTLEDEFPEVSAAESSVPGELTREFYVPEDLVDQSSAGEPHDVTAGPGDEADAIEAVEGTDSLPAASVESSEEGPEPPGADESVELKLMDTEDEPAEEEASEFILDFESDDLLETGLVLELEDDEEETAPPQSEKRPADSEPDGPDLNQLDLEDDEKS